MSLHYIKQNIAPQKLISQIAHFCANNQTIWFKNFLIRYFLNNYKVNMAEAIIENPFEYKAYNDFFTRKLKPEARKIDQDNNSIISPADGYMAQFGNINQNKIIQAKNHNFSLQDLIATNKIQSEYFIDGKFCTVYLAPHNYHRVHIPVSGKILQMAFIPGKLFSVSNTTAETIPNLFARNERLVIEIETEINNSNQKIIVILVGAMIVGSIETAWEKNINSNNRNKIRHWGYTDKNIYLNKGQELGLFKLGSTVITLFPKNYMAFNNFDKNQIINMGSNIGTIL